MKAMHNLNNGVTICYDCIDQYTIDELCPNGTTEDDLIILHPSIRLSNPQLFPGGEECEVCHKEVLPPIEGGIA